MTLEKLLEKAKYLDELQQHMRDDKQKYDYQYHFIHVFAEKLNVHVQKAAEKWASDFETPEAAAAPLTPIERYISEPDQT